ncbi:phage terminase large subunit [Micromonospora sp. NPDC049366]|uniref:phage terminase large subunit n=1 Tax=Micromonospora sp. NPDC049366 TaxID=3364271 RepID=UPI0037AE5EDA
MPSTQRSAGARRPKKPARRGLSPLDQLRLDRLYRLRELKRRQADEARTRNAGKWSTPGAMAAELDPDTVQTAALDLIDAALVDVAEGRCKRLIITMPPQEGKSQRVSRRFPLWLLVRRPSARIVLVGYELGIARRWGRTIKNDIATHGDALGLGVRDDTSAAHEWQLAGEDGGVYCVGIGGALTGRPADVMIIDDPHKGRKEADSLLQRENVWEWWTETARTRFGTETPVVLVQTRWHEDDLAGRLLEHDAGSWRVINIPAEADHRPAEGETDPLGRAPGEFLVSTRGRHLPRPMGTCPKHPGGVVRPDGGRRECCDWDDLKHDVGSRGWQALYQGSPTPGAGVIFNRQWWQRYEQPQWTVRADGSHWAVGFDEVIISVDCAFKATEGSDYVAMQVWGRRGLHAYLLDQVHDQLTFVETCARLAELAAKWPQAILKLVEDAANGPAVVNALALRVPGLVPVTPDGSKVARAAAVSPFVEGRGVWLPDPKLAPWVGGLITEASAFPQSPNDDRVDALSQALNRLLLNPLIVEDEVVEDNEDGDPEGSISPY